MNEDTTKRTIEEVYDIKEGVFIESKEFFSRSESEIMAFRKHLEEAIQLNEPRFVCSHCRQMVKISGKSSEKGRVSFFSHLYDSDDCDIKTTTQLSKEDIEARKYGMVGESERHKRLKQFINTYLLSGKYDGTGVSDVYVSKRIKSDIPYLNWRCPDVTAVYKGKRLVFELQLSTTFLSVIVDRDIFYRLNNYYVIWVFNFENEKKLSLENLLAKDIYYANKRNVFILDQEAMDKSMEEKKLYLSVTWLGQNNKFVEKRLVTIDDLSFDDSNCKPYYFDADALYYQDHPEEEQRVISLERSRQDVLNALMAKKKAEEEKARRIAEAQAKKREEMLQAGKVATPYAKGKKWGYEYDGTKLTLPIYTSASEINNDGYGYVVRNRRTGLVNQCGEEILPCRFKSIYPLSNGCFVVNDDGSWSVYNSSIIDKVKKDDVIIIHSLNDQFVSITIKREKEDVVAIVGNNGEFKIVDAIGDFHDKIATVTLKGIWKSGGSWFDGSWWHYERKSYVNGEKRLFTYNGFFLREDANLSKDIIPATSFSGGVGVLSIDLLPISPFSYSSLSIIDNVSIKVSKEGKWGLLTKKAETGLFEEQIPCRYDDLVVLSIEHIKVKRKNKWGIINYKNKIIVPIRYDSIGEISGDKVCVKKASRMGLCDLTGVEVVEDKNNFADNIIIGRSFEKYGLSDLDNNIILDYEYDKIELIGNKCIRADNCLFKLNGELICSNISHVQLFENGIVACNTNRQVYLFDSSFCRILLEYNISSISDFIDNIAEVKLVSGKTGRINDKGQVVVDCIEPLNKGLSKIKYFGSWGIRKENGEWLCQPIYEDIVLLGKDRMALILLNGFVIIDNKGTIVKEIDGLKFIELLNSSLIKVSSGSLYGLCKKDGSVKHKCVYSELTSTENDFIITKRIEKKTKRISYWRTSVCEYEYCGLLKPNGVVAFDCKYRSVDVSNNSIHILDDGHHHIQYDFDKNKLCEYYHVESLNNEFRKISNSNLKKWEADDWGVVNSSWRQIVPCHFEAITMLSDYWFALKKDGKWGCVSIDLTQSFPCKYPNVVLNGESQPSVRLGNKCILCKDFIERKRLEIGKSYVASVDEVRPYGLMLNVENYKCLLHISEFRRRKQKMESYKVGDTIDVIITDFDKNKKRYILSLT